jgi:GTP cyclohydrolase I
MGFNESHVRTLLEGIGEDPDREGLRETPARVVKAWAQWTSGYDQDPAAILKVFEDAQYDEMVFHRLHR